VVDIGNPVCKFYDLPLKGGGNVVAGVVEDAVAHLIGKV
jgi:hypothetical protein